MKFFKEDDNWQFNSRIGKDDNKWLYYGEGYRIAIELIESQILEIDRSNQDFLIYPYCFLIRHFIEIRLKEIIDEGSKVINKQINPSEKEHNLNSLWSDSQGILKLVWEGNFKKAPSEVSGFINELHTIDLRSDTFRYPIKKNGKDTLAQFDIINFNRLAEAFRNVKYYLDGVTDGIAVIKDSRNQ